MSASSTRGRVLAGEAGAAAADVAPARPLYTRFAAGLLFPLHERLKGHGSVAIRRRLERSQWGSAADIEREQADRLRAFLAEIGARVPYYRELFRRVGFDPATVRSAADLQRLPLLTKADIRAHGERMKAEGHGPLSRYNTGGSSGEPLVFYIGKQRKSHDVAAKWRATRWWGVDIGDREAVIWGSPIEHGAQDRMRAVRDGLFRSTLLPAFEMSEARLDQFVTWLRRHRPTMLFGYPSALTYIARHADKRGQRLDDLGVKVAFVTSERLYDDQRATIARVFGCRVANGYGGRDAGFIAHECPSGGMHISAEDIIVETVDKEGQPVRPGEAGEIVVTELSTDEFPFVRYRTGDIGTLDDASCPCGRGLPMLRDLQGRTTDFVVAADGTVMHGLALIYILRDMSGIGEFKVTQESRSFTRVEIVPDERFDPSVINAIEQGFRHRLGATVEIHVQTVAALPRERSGKYRYIVSHAL
ncbi:MAG: phenylacetate--CoA ligase family protein [Rubrivivax sp.]|nr:phenylacetate--CoA ligase family protein [Rubrivivax sp.]